MNWELFGIIYMIVIGISIVGMLMWLVFYYKKNEEIYERKYYFLMNYINKKFGRYTFNELLEELKNIYDIYE